MPASYTCRTPADPAHVLWIAVIISSYVCLSALLACATPFAALAAFAALRTDLRSAVLLVAAAWLANQAIGYGLLGYPQTWNSIAWGLSIGFSACLGVLAARAFNATRPAPLATSLPFMAAFTVYEAGLYATALLLPDGGGFTPSAIGYVFLVNAGSFVVLLVGYHLIVAVLGRQFHNSAGFAPK